MRIARRIRISTTSRTLGLSQSFVWIVVVSGFRPSLSLPLALYSIRAVSPDAIVRPHGPTGKIHPGLRAAVLTWSGASPALVMSHPKATICPTHTSPASMRVCLHTSFGWGLSGRGG